MRYKFHTATGARYLIDIDEMTWKRDGENALPAHKILYGMGTDHGELYDIPEVSIGETAAIQFGPYFHDYITTSIVQLIELL